MHCKIEKMSQNAAFSALELPAGRRSASSRSDQRACRRSNSPIGRELLPHTAFTIWALFGMFALGESLPIQKRILSDDSLQRMLNRLWTQAMASVAASVGHSA